MKTKQLLFFAVIALWMIHSNAFSQAIDTFYIDKSGYGNYTSINNAVNALKTTTLYKPRVYIIKAGTYTENISIPQISGSSASNYVVFQGENKNTVIVSSSSGNTIELNGADHFTFENMTVKGSSGCCFYLHNKSDYIKIHECMILNDTISTQDYPAIHMHALSNEQNISDNLSIANNIIKGGYIGIYLNGKDTILRSNNVNITNNFIDKGKYGSIDINSCKNALIDGNLLYKIKTIASNIKVSNSKKTIIKNNYVFQGYSGILFIEENTKNSSTNDSSFVINNIVFPDINYSGASHGLSFSLSKKVIAFNNSIWVHNSNTSLSGAALRINQVSGCVTFNNIFATSGKAYSVLISNSSNINSDYNDYYYPNVGTNAFYIDNVAKSYNQFKATSFGYTHDVHSYNNTNPHFVSSSDLHLDSTYYPLYGIDKGVTTDIDGDTRCPYKTTIGADESRYPLQKPKTGFNILGNICVLATVQLKNTTTGVTPMGYQWFINGSLVAKTINYNYYVSAPTTDTITLIADNCGGHDTFTKILSVSGPVADFKVARQTPIVNHDTVEFINLTDCSPNITKWEIQPSTFHVISSYPNGSNPKIVFTDTGCYDVKLIVARGSFYDTLIRTCYIKAIDSVYIILNGVNPHFMEACHGYKDVGASCYAFSGNPPSLHYDSSYQTFIDTGLYNQLFRAINPSTGDTIKVIRAVHVKPDLTKPIITLMGNNPDTIEAGIPYSEPGFSSMDSCGILTDGVSGIVYENLVGTYILRYFATDNNGNTDTIERIVFVVDITPPTLALIEDTVVVEVYNAYEMNIVINDNYCSVNEMTIHSMGNIDTSKLGFYFNTIWVEDCNGNFSDTATQVVWIVDRTSPVLIWTGPDTFYLERYKILNPDPDTHLTIWDNYDTNIIPVASGTYYTTYLVSRGEGCYSIIYDAMDQSGNISNEIGVWVCITPSAINETSHYSDIRIYPNPNNGQFVIENKSTTQPIQFIQVFNSRGKLVYAAKHGDNYIPKIEIDLKQSAGLYFIMLQSNSGIVMKKVVVE